jgi:succinate-semialdehyde dehydrogenase/glutarate-semialdehyde dehydrogenase
MLSLSREDLIRTRNFIGGAWAESSAGTFAVRDPSDEQTIVDVGDSMSGDALAAVEAAHAALPAWRAATAHARSRLLKRWHAMILENQEDLARLISREQGKPLAEARGEIAYAASYVEWFSEEATRSYGEVIPETVSGRRMLTVRTGVGIVAAITPWNFPAAMITRKIAPALAAGCTIVAKPAEDTPLTSLALAVLAEEAGFPAGVLNIVVASRSKAAEVVDVWLADARVRKVTFTGSTPVGKHLARDSASTLKRLSLELGGNAPFIVFDDADIDAAVDGLLAAKFRNGGQTCVSPNRVFAQDAIHDEFVTKLATRVAALRVGPAREEASQIGPMINQQAVRKIEDHIADALSGGARVLVGGTRVRTQEGPNFVAPTVLVGATRSMKLANEETFGPVAAIFRFGTEDEVIAAANGTPFGLAAYFYSNDLQRVARVSGALECGILGVNEGLVSSAAAPFGGIKDSGYGREGSRHGLDDYTEIKYVCQGGLS